MITMVGALPVRQGLTSEEKEAFFTWGAWIQRADALADLEREIRDGFISTIPGWTVARTGEPRYLKAVAEEDFPWIYRKRSSIRSASRRQVCCWMQVLGWLVWGGCRRYWTGFTDFYSAAMSPTRVSSVKGQHSGPADDRHR